MSVRLGYDLFGSEKQVPVKETLIDEWGFVDEIRTSNGAITELPDTSLSHPKYDKEQAWNALKAAVKKHGAEIKRADVVEYKPADSLYYNSPRLTKRLKPSKSLSKLMEELGL